ncbi:MAG TPA: TldD/PmbA family protein [Acidobacteriota bacterium]
MSSVTYQELVETAEEAVRQALRYGSDQVDAVLISESEFQANTRNGEVELIKQAASKTLGLRVIEGRRAAITSTSDLSQPTVESLAQEALALARQTSEDPFLFLPERELYQDLLLTQRWLDLEGLNAGADQKIALAAAAEGASLEFDPRIRNSEGGSFRSSHAVWCYANSHGYSGVFPSTIFSLASIPVAVENGAMQRDYWYSASCFLKKLRSPQEIGETAARRALRRLGARKILSCEVPVIFDPLTASAVVQKICEAINGAAIYRKASFLLDRLGEAVASPAVTLIDDPTLVDGLGSRPFDAEGLPTRPLTLIREGVLENYLLDSYSARKLGLKTTASANRRVSEAPNPGPSNFYLRPGSSSPEELIASVKKGLYITELIGFGVNIVNGDYSQGAIGLWIEDGELRYSVQEITIAGNLGDMLNSVEAVANDLEFLSPVSSPTFKISHMTVSGK